MKSHDGQVGPEGGQHTRALNILWKCLDVIIWITKGKPKKSLREWCDAIGFNITMATM